VVTRPVTVNTAKYRLVSPNSAQFRLQKIKNQAVRQILPEGQSILFILLKTLFRRGQTLVYRG
jgi:hypothetical protein